MIHTTGPWTHEAANRDHHGHYICDGIGKTVCDLYFLHRKDRSVVEFENSEANAQLIAAAPDLLEALTSIMEELPPHTNDHDWMEDGLRRAVEAACDAIAKATEPR